LKILVAGPFLENWSLSSYMVESFKRLGHKVFHFDYRHNLSTFIKYTPVLRSPYTIAYFRRFDPTIDYNFVKVVKKFSPDFILVIKGESISAKTVVYIRKKMKVPIVNWFPDDPQFFSFISRYLYSAYDYYFSSSFMTVEKLKKKGFKRVEYIAFACDPEVHKFVNLTKEEKIKYNADINFMGTFYFERLKYIKTLKNYDLKLWGKWWPLFVKLYGLQEKYQGRGIYYKDFVKAFAAAKIVLNIHLPAMKYGGMKSNLRNFEAAGSKSFILCDNTVGIEDLFKPGKEIEIYNNKYELHEKINYYLKNPKKRQEIAENAQKRCYKEHTYKHRAKQILEILKHI